MCPGMGGILLHCVSDNPLMENTETMFLIHDSEFEETE